MTGQVQLVLIAHFYSTIALKVLSTHTHTQTGSIHQIDPSGVRTFQSLISCPTKLWQVDYGTQGWIHQSPDWWMTCSATLVPTVKRTVL